MKKLIRSELHSALGARYSAPLFLLLLLTPLFFWRETLGWRVLGDQDATFWFLPAYDAVAAQIRAFELPLWNPYIYGGAPLFGAWQAGVLDPLNLLYAILGATTRTLTLVQELSFALALLSSYLYTQSLRFSRRASVFAAIVYAFGGYPVARVLYPGLLHVTALAPLALFCVERIYDRAGERRVWRAAAGGAAVIAWQIFAAHPQPLVYSMLLSSAYALFCAFARDLERGRRWRFLAACAVMFGGGLGLGMVQLLPAWEVAQASGRGAWTYDLFILNSLHPASLLVTLFPFFHGGGTGIFQLPFWGNYWHHHEAQIYLGIAPLALAAAGAVGGWRARNRMMTFWSAAGAIAVLLTLGKYAGPLAWAIYRIPVIDSFRSSNRHWMEVALAASVLAGYAIDRLLKENERMFGRLLERFSLALTLAVVLIGGLALTQREAIERLLRALPDLGHLPAGFLSGSDAEFLLPIAIASFSCLALLRFIRSRKREEWATALIAILLLDLQLYAVFAPIGDAQRRDEMMGAAIPAQLRASKSNSSERSSSESSPSESGSSRGGEPHRFHLLLHREAGQFDPFYFAGHEMVTGYDPLLSARYKRFSGIEEAGRCYLNTITEEGDRTLDLLNVRYLMVAPQVFDEAALAKLTDEEREMARRWRAGLESAGRWRESDVRSDLADYRDFRVYENLRALPRAWLVGRVEALDEWDRLRMIRGELSGRSFDPRQVALVSREDAARIEAQIRARIGARPAPASDATAGHAEIIEQAPGRMALAVRTDRPALLVLSQVYAPGWRARAAGQELEVWRVNEVLSAVAIPPGEHQIILRYWPRSLTIGAAASLLTALALIAILIRSRGIWSRSGARLSA